MRIVTRPDFDGIVCAVIIRHAVDPGLPIVWTEPHQIQSRLADIRSGDILANLPYDDRCSVWFDHHVSNEPDHPFDGCFEVAPSAARVAYAYYKRRGQLAADFDELIYHTDKIDSADLTRDEVLYPERHPYILLSMTIQNHGPDEEPFWNLLVDRLGTGDIDAVMAEPEVDRRCRLAIVQNQAFSAFLKTHTTVSGHISITDFRPLDTVPSGNRFLTYCLFPESAVSVKIRYKDPEKTQVLLSVGKSIFNPACWINIGKLLQRFGGGGHAGAGGCTLEGPDVQEKIDAILSILKENQPNS